jgi:hypothetical protein
LPRNSTNSTPRPRSLPAELARELRDRAWNGPPFLMEREDGRLTDSQGREYRYDENGRLLGPHGFPLPHPPDPDMVTVVIARRAEPRADA